MLQFVTAGVFLTSAVSKLRLSEARTQFVYALDTLGFRKPSVVAKGVTLFEALIAVACLIPGAGTVGLSGALLAMSALTAVIFNAIRRGIAVAWPLFRAVGPSGRPLGPIHVIRNALIAAVAAGALLLRFHSHETVSVSDAAVIVALGAIFVFLIPTFDTLMTVPLPAFRSKKHESEAVAIHTRFHLWNATRSSSPLISVG